MNQTRQGQFNPVVVLVLVALVPTIVLAGLRSILPEGNSAPTVELSSLASTGSQVVTDRSLMTLRRVAPEISGRANRAQLTTALNSVSSAMASSSCFALSVDGVPLELSGSRSAIPASTVKIIIAAAAVELLGKDFTFTTRVMGPSPVGGVINGDVVLVGGGDPLLSGDWYPNSNLDRYPVFGHTSLDALASSLASSGVTAINGRVLGDGTRYDDEWYYSEWGKGVAGIEAGPIDALMANDARIEGDSYRASDPAAGAAREFVQRLSAVGVQVSAGTGVGVPAATDVELATIESASLPVVVAEMLQNSDNNTAEMLVKEMGLQSTGVGNRANGLAAVASTLESMGVDISEMNLVDGSGLSNSATLRCQTLVDTLEIADQSVIDGLAVAGVSGTLSTVFTDGPMTGRLKAKTGTLGNLPFNEDPPAVKSLSGEFVASGGETLTFALLLNQSMVNDQSNYRPIWDSLASAFAAYPSGPTVSEMAP